MTPCEFKLLAQPQLAEPNAPWATTPLCIAVRCAPAIDRYKHVSGHMFSFNLLVWHTCALTCSTFDTCGAQLRL